MPKLTYRPGDSVSVTIAEWSEASDFNYLTAHHPRDADGFYAFSAELPPPKTEPDCGFQIFPLLAVQITLFPGTGIPIGFSYDHVVGDASSIDRFLRAWSFVAKLGGDDQLLAANRSPLPLYDRSVVKDPSGRRLCTWWNQINQSKTESLPSNFPSNQVRSTYILRREDIQKLKNLAQAKKAYFTYHLLRLPALMSGPAWSNPKQKPARRSTTMSQNTSPSLWTRGSGRIPPIPAAYFGNCLGLAVVESTHSELKGDDGFPIAAELIGEVISQKVNKTEELLRDAQNWISIYVALMGKRVFGVAGSPKFDLYDADLGWGKPEKYEYVSVNKKRFVSLGKSREFQGGLEIGLALPEYKMDAFATAFSSLLD